jgi:hypothetical protein
MVHRDHPRFTRFFLGGVWYPASLLKDETLQGRRYMGTMKVRQKAGIGWDWISLVQMPIWEMIMRLTLCIYHTTRSGNDVGTSWSHHTRLWRQGRLSNELRLCNFEATHIYIYNIYIRYSLYTVVESVLKCLPHFYIIDIQS